MPRTEFELGRFQLYDDGNPDGEPFDTPALGEIQLLGQPMNQPMSQPDDQAASQLRREIADVLNRHSKENGSNTPDWILADYLIKCLDAFDSAIAARETWYGREPKTGPAGVLTEGSAVQAGDPQCP